MYLEEYIRQNTESKQERSSDAAPISSREYLRSCFEADPALKELWGLYMDKPGSPYMKRIGCRSSEVPARNFKI